MADSWVAHALRSLVVELNGVEDTNVVSIEEADAYMWRVELIYRELLVKEASGYLNDGERNALPFVIEAHSRIMQIMEDCELHSRFPPSIIIDGHVGRPRFMIPYHQLEFLVYSHFTVPQISQLLGVSVSTIRRRMKEYDITVQGTYSDV